MNKKELMQEAIKCSLEGMNSNAGGPFGAVIAKDGEIIAGKCVNERKNGSEWTKAEISNWENGLEVDCSYF